ncbi:MAG: MG2 domain-containing protein, partial [Acidobacteria bacterium]|nr:MG2 domain-containing protein [Acidobacteriota bacterium]
FVVFAKKGSDLAYVVNNWCEGLEPWNFEVPYNWNISQTSQIAGIVFSDRGVYKLQEEVHFKAILRKKEKEKMALYPKGTIATAKLYDSKGKVKESKEFEISLLGGIDGVFEIGKDYPLGNYRIEVSVDDNKISGGFLVAAYRKPEFKVNVDLENKENKIEGKISSSYLFGSPLSKGKVKFYYSDIPSYSVPESVSKNFKLRDWDFFPSYLDRKDTQKIEKENEGTLDENGELKLNFDFAPDTISRTITLEAQVEDITKQTITNRAEITVYPDYYVGICSREWGFDNYKEGLKTKIVVLDKEGNLVKDKEVEVELKKVVYRSAQSSTGYNYYNWESRRDYESVSKKEII